MKLDISIKHTRKQHAMKTLKVLTARQVPVKILAAHNLPDDILHVRAAITIQSAYRTAIAIRKARLRKAIVEAGYMDARRMKPYKPWEITDVMGLGLHQGWIQLRKWGCTIILSTILPQIPNFYVSSIIVGALSTFGSLFEGFNQSYKMNLIQVSLLGLCT